MTIQEAGRQLLSQLLKIYDDQEANNIQDWVMENITGKKKMERLAGQSLLLPAEQEVLWKQYCIALQSGKPVQYVLHEAWFYKMKLYVDERVLIPRPETEELVEWVIASVDKNKKHEVHILDIGTGSGCIALALKKNLPNAIMHACDISIDALAVARKNASEQQLTIDFHLLNILSAKERDTPGSFDIIVSNPPYIPVSEKNDMAAHVVDHEPSIALFVEDNDPLIFYKAIADFAKTHLSKNGCMYFEIHESLGGAVIELFKSLGFPAIELKKDLQVKDRMMKISY